MKRLLRAILPSHLVRHLQEARTLPAGPRLRYVRLLASRAMGVRRDRRPHDPRSGPVVFICHGNIIRSALAEALFRRATVALRCTLRVESAGLFAVNGREADSRAIAVASALGVSLRSHRARALTAEMARDASLLVVMDHLNEAVLIDRFPWAARKVALLGGLTGSEDAVTGISITDPFSGSDGDVRAAGERIARAVTRLARDLDESGPRSG